MALWEIRSEMLDIRQKIKDKESISVISVR